MEAPTYFRVVETDNFDSDYPNEKWVEPLPIFITPEQAQRVVAALLEGRAEHLHPAPRVRAVTHDKPLARKTPWVRYRASAGDPLRYFYCSRCGGDETHHTGEESINKLANAERRFAATHRTCEERQRAKANP